MSKQRLLKKLHVRSSGRTLASVYALTLPLGCNDGSYGVGKVAITP